MRSSGSPTGRASCSQVIGERLGVRYVYIASDRFDGVHAVAASRPSALSDAVRDLPPALIDQLRDAAIEGRAKRLESLADQAGAIRRPRPQRFEPWPATSATTPWSLRSNQRHRARTRAPVQGTDDDRPVHPLASVLVVDDTIENLRLLGTMLGEEGYEVRPVTNGRQALQAVEHDPPDLILLDINMPDMDGYEVCRRVRENDQSKDVPVIFLTALADRATRSRPSTWAASTTSPSRSSSKRCWRA